MPAPPATSTRSPGDNSNAAAPADVHTSPTASTPIFASAASWVANVAEELLVTNNTRWPAARIRAIASTEPAIG